MTRRRCRRTARLRHPARSATRRAVSASCSSASSSSSAARRACRRRSAARAPRRPARAGAGRSRRAAGGALRVERERDGVGKAAAQALHRVGGTHRVRQRRLHPGAFAIGEPRVGEQLVERTAQCRERTGDRARKQLDGRCPPDRRPPRRDGLALRRLGERERHRRAAVAAARADRLRAVQVAECDVIDAVEGARRHVRGAADREIPFALARLGAGDERVRHRDDGAGAPSGSARTRAIAAPSTAACERSCAPSCSRTRSGSR